MAKIIVYYVLSGEKNVFRVNYLSSDFVCSMMAGGLSLSHTEELPYEMGQEFLDRQYYGSWEFAIESHIIHFLFALELQGTNGSSVQKPGSSVL